MHASKALVILRMSISRQRCPRNNLSWVMTNCSNAKSNQQLLKVYDYLPICLFVLVLKVYDSIHVHSGTCTWQFLLYIVLSSIIIIQRKSATWPHTHKLVSQITKSILFFFVKVSMVMGWYNVLWSIIKSAWKRDIVRLILLGWKISFVIPASSLYRGAVTSGFPSCKLKPH